MGKKKHIDMIEQLFKKSIVVDYSSIERIVRHKNKKSTYAKQLVRNLLTQGKITKLAKGWYTSRDDPELAVLCFSPSYLGLQDALSFHNLWEQETIPVIITSRKIRQGIREANKSNILIRKLDKKYIFGFEYFESGKEYLPRSDIEKTLIDLVYFNENISEEALKNIKKRIDWKKTEKYLKKYPKKIREKVATIIGIEK